MKEFKGDGFMKRKGSALVVALMIFVFSLVGCGNTISDENVNNAQDNEKEPEYVEVESITSDSETTSLNQEKEAVEEEKHIDKESIETVPEVTAASDETMSPADAIVPFIESEVSDVVWANTNINVRSGPGTGYDIIGILDYGDCVNRIAITDNGWCKIVYGDVSAYVYGKLVQTDEVKPVSDTQASESDSTELCVGDAKIIFDEVNRVREEVGLSPLTWSDDLARAADIRAGEIIETFSHTRPDGTTFRTISSLADAENIIRGPHSNGYEMMEKWMDSEGHKANILWPDLRIIGVATRRTEMGDTGVQLFGY